MQTDPTQFFNLEFVEFDSFVETAQSFDWHPVQLSKGALNLRFRALDAGDFGVFHLKFDPRVHDKSVISPGTVAFSLVMSACDFAGVSVAQPTLGIMLDTREYRSTFEPGFACHEFYCRRDLVELHPIGELILDSGRRASDLVVGLDTRSAYRLRSVLADLTRRDCPFVAPPVRAATRLAVLNLIYRMIAPRLGSPERPVRRPRRSDLVSSALSLIESTTADFDAADLAGRLGVSRRALEKSFNAALGITPGQFLLARKLTSVRDRLARGDGPVGEIASEEGFEHLSRFAGQYRRLFDELPSETLLRSKLTIRRPSSQIG